MRASHGRYVVKEKRRLRVDVLDAGLIAQAAHLEASRKARHVELYSLCDAAPDLLGKVAAILEPAKTFGDYDALHGDKSVDAVVVAIADQFHVAMAEQALEAGKHVLIEKPMGISIGECEDHTCALGRGIVDFETFFGLLQSAGFRGPVITHGFEESEAPESTRRAQAKLREVMANAVR